MGMELLFLTQICVGILMIIFLHKITQVQMKMDNITKEVQNYLNFISEEEVETQRKKEKKRDGSQSQLIQAVLKEYFP